MLQNNKPTLVCVVGPTAIGKTALAIELATHFKCEIISADSRQFYKEMEIGTAVPSRDELAQVKHHFIQNKSIHTAYSVGDFEKEALITLSSLFKKNPIQVMVGGSGLYVDAVTKGLHKFPHVPSIIRDELQTEINRDGIEKLQNELKKVDPNTYTEIDLNNPHRLIRALGVVRASGQPFSHFKNAPLPKRDFNVVYVGIQADRKVIYDRINLRVDLMMQNGLLEEATALYPNKSLNALQTVGYKELFLYLDHKCTLEKAIEEIKKNTRRFAKRQLTWFTKNKSIYWFDRPYDLNEIIQLIQKKCSK